MKKFCVLDQGGNHDTIIYTHNKQLFSTPFSDYYRLNFRKINDPNAFVELDFPNVFSEGRCALYDLIPKNYEYYIFIDDDVTFLKKEKKNNSIKWIKNSPDIPSIIANFFDIYKPIHGTFYRPTDRQQPSLTDNISHNVINIKGFDVTSIFYHHSFAKIMFPIPIHGIYGIFKLQQYIAYKLFPNKVMCFLDIATSNNRKGSYKNGNISGSWKIWDGPILMKMARNTITTLNSLVLDNDFLIYSSTHSLHQENMKILSNPISKNNIHITKKDLEKIINTKHPLFQNKTVVHPKNMHNFIPFKKYINFQNIYCRHLINFNYTCKDNWIFNKPHYILPILDSIHYQALITNDFTNYINLLNTTYQPEHSLEIFKRLINTFDLNKIDKIKIEYSIPLKKFIILDGLHRLSIIIFKNLFKNGNIPFKYFFITK